jgi:hypothetical protein
VVHYTKSRCLATPVPLWCAALLALLLAGGCGGEAKHLGLFGPGRLSHVLGQDGVTPVPLSDDVTLWTFGDTIVGAWKGGTVPVGNLGAAMVPGGMLSNSCALSGPLSHVPAGKLSFRYLSRDGKVARCIPLLPGEKDLVDRQWPFDGIRLGDDLYVYYARIRVVQADQPMGFRVAGVGLAHWRVPPGWTPDDGISFTRLPDLFTGSVPALGASVLHHGEYLYVTGQYSDGFMRSPLTVARVTPGEIRRAPAYRFLKRDGSWVPGVGQGDGFFGDVMGESSLSWNAYLGKFVIIYARLFSREIVMVDFRDFSELDTAEVRVIYRGEPRGAANDHYYSAKEIYASGRYLYFIYIDGVDYQPYLVRLDL